jgi:glycosyltransferase involved in cell wall biosynthesis
MSKLSVVIATRNEEENIADCLSSVDGLADEIIIVDEYSTDKTRTIAKSLGAKIFLEPHHAIFHITKQKALSLAKGKWVLQLDADERVSAKLACEIKKVIDMTDDQIEKYQKTFKEKRLFERHQKLVEKRDGKFGKEMGEYAGFFIPRRNFFLGKYLRYGGTYPDGVIRLVKKSKAHFPCKSVHEQIEIEGKVGWLANPLYHKDSQTLRRYLRRNSRYIDLLAQEIANQKTKKSIKNAIFYYFVLPTVWFLQTTIRHKGILDGWQGLVFSFFSALRFPRAYFRYTSF